MTSTLPPPWPGWKDTEEERRYVGDDETVRRLRPILGAVNTGRHTNIGVPLDYEERDSYRQAADTIIRHLKSEPFDGPLHHVIEFLISTVNWVAADTAADETAGNHTTADTDRFPRPWPYTPTRNTTSHPDNSIPARLNAIILAIGLRPGVTDLDFGPRDDYMNTGEDILDHLDHEKPGGPLHTDLAFLIATVDWVAHDVTRTIQASTQPSKGTR